MKKLHNGIIKTCKKCRKTKPLSEFYGRTRDDSYHHSCKSCISKQKKAYRANQSPEQKAARLEAYSAYSRDRNARIKDAVFQYYGGYVCACCGETERKFLTLDHISNDGAQFRRRIARGNRQAAGSHTYGWLYRHGFPPGFQVLCMNCNHGKRMNKGVCPHQVRSNDYPSTGVGSSDPKRSAPSKPILGEDIVSSTAKTVAVN